MLITRDDCLCIAVGQNPHAVEPKESDIWCWHCSHPFLGHAVPLPIKYDSRTQVWKTIGTFCSWGCAKAWNWDSGIGYRSGIRGELLTLLKKRTIGKLERTVPAPPRTCLRVFGGTLTIQEFRKQSTAGIITECLPEKMIAIETVVHSRRVENARKAAVRGPDLKETVNFEGTMQKNETLRLKRPKPMPSSNDVLARAMGLEIFT